MPFTTSPAKSIRPFARVAAPYSSVDTDDTPAAVSDPTAMTTTRFVPATRVWFTVARSADMTCVPSAPGSSGTPDPPDVIAPVSSPSTTGTAPSRHTATNT
jgi:hypothetical protein